MSSNEILIQKIAREMSLYTPIILLIFGSYGSLCNFITFTSKQLRTSSCAFYFLCTAITELIAFYFGLISRLASDRLGSTLFLTNVAYCKIRSYLVVALPALVTYMILLTTIDRFMSTTNQVRYRSFSQLKVAHRIVPIVIIISMILTSHMLVFYNFFPACTAQPGIYSVVYSVYLFIWTGILPNGFILLFSWLTIRNVIKTKQRVGPTTTKISKQQRHAQRTDSQLIVMMLSQAILSCCLDLIRIALYGYFVLSTDLPKSSYQRSIDGLLLQISIFLLYGNCSKSFYVYTLTSGFFRKIFRYSIEYYFRKILFILHIKQDYDWNSTRFMQSTLNGSTLNYELKTIPDRQIIKR
ncbi:unnamed protein product [Rotaria sordida]|uniref:G-protein coupled receptors family 1 profile domain-containing protein n=1 Tax=Rotaria sordida TaxID=392033 RepID=A0A813P2I9_9BILA|nr:unnamed protein product [Rotaria sordida]CAF0792063.1 unnamed protein product [Rotaria sordida]CAF0822167.1 unnamed protein product [Rotaria sordida]CAF0822409.1 unnamed protein product [Rotaria sordida]CAF3611209.1 unnamed protein product [Rotaria sordida]